MEVSDRIIIYSKKELIAELAGTVLAAMHYASITAPQDLYSGDGYTEDAQDRFNELHDLIEKTVEDLEL